MNRSIILLIIIALSFNFTACSTSAPSGEKSDQVEDLNDEIAEESEDLSEDGAEESAAENTSEASDEVAEDSSSDEEFEEDDFGEEAASEDEMSEDKSDQAAAEESFDEDFAEDDTADEVAQEEGGGDEAIAEEPAQEEMADQAAVEENPEEIAQEIDEAPQGEAMAAPMEEAGASAGLGDQQSVVGLDFLSNEAGGTIVISTSGPVEVQKRKNLETGQYVIELPNTLVPAKFQRPYNTQEFNGAIGMFKAYQAQDSNVARFVIQLNQDSEPLVEREGNSILIVASKKTVQQEVAETTGSTDLKAEDIYEPSVDQSQVQGDQAILASKTVEDYLSGNTKFYGRRINIELKDVDIRDVFDFIAEQSGLNIIVSDQVKGNINVKLRQIPWDQALVTVMQTKQLGYVRSGNILRIAPLTDLKKESEDAREVIEAQRGLQPLRIKIFPVSYAKAKDLLPQLKDFVTQKRGNIKADERTNNIILTDIAENIQKIGKLIEDLDTETPQVLMEAKIIEAKEEFKRKIGFNYKGDANTTGDTITLDYFNVPKDDGITFTFNSVSLFGKLEAFLSLSEEESLVRVIAAPRIVGLNNIQSKISQTTQVYDKTITVDDQGNKIATVTAKDVNLELVITPQITADGGVLMNIKLKREFGGNKLTFGDGGSDSSEVTPVNKREAQTTVLVPNGDTVVIGGVYQNDVTDGSKKIPFLADIPIIGYLFKGKSYENLRNELMVFVTPRVLNSEKAFSRGEKFIEQTQNSMQDQQM